MKLLILIIASAVIYGQAQTEIKIIPKQDDSATGIVKFQEKYANGSNYVGLRAPNSISSNVLWTLPSSDGTSGQCLSTDGAGVLSFAACAGSGAFFNGGNSFGGTARIGTNDNYPFHMKTNNVIRWDIAANGHFIPDTHNTYNIGHPLYRPAIIYSVLGAFSTNITTPKIGRDSADSLTFFTNSADRWTIDNTGIFLPAADDTFDVGLTGTRVRGMYAKFGEFYKSGSTASSDYLTTRKYNILDQSGGSGVWDIQASGSMASTSSIKIRDNAGSRWLEAYRAIAGTPLKYTSLFGHLYPAKRLISDGDAVDDSVFGDLGASTARWANVWGGTANFTALTLPTGSSAGYVWTDQGSGVGAWAEGGRDAYDVRNFGAVCNGSTDDTTAIQSAITAAVGIKGMVILPQGTCKVSTLDITSSFRGLRGQGVNVTWLKSTTNAPIIRIDTGTGGSATNFYNLEFSNMTIIGDGTSSGQYAFEVKGEGSVNNSDFHHLWIEDVQIAMYAHLDGTTGSGHNKFHDNWFSLGNTNAIGIYRYAPEGSGWMISGNDFGGAAGSLGDTSGARAIVMRKFVGDLMINDNHMEGGWVAVDLSCDDGKLPKAITAGTNANPVSLTATGHGRSGSITVSLNGFTGSWAALNGEWTATVTGANTFTVPVNSTSFGAMTGANAELTSSGACSYGNQVVATGNKIDGYALDGRFYNIQNSSFAGNRGRGLLREQIRGSKNALTYDQMGQIDTGSAILRSGLEFTTAYGNLSLNAYDEGRIRIGDTSSDLSATKNGISILDASYSSAIALGQSTTRNMGMFWTRAATPSDAYGVIYTYGYSNGLLYGASLHRFTGGKVYADGNGPALGAGQNISNVWANGSSGFVSLGVYRTDDTNGGWLIGTSAVSVGDFAIYQNQGASAPVQRLLIGTSGGVDIPGTLTSGTINSTGSPAYRVSGTTVIDASRNATFANLTINTGAATVGYVWTATSTGGAGSWQAATGGSTLPVVDTTGIAKGSSDATKILRFEVDGFTTATTRTLTPQNNSYTIAGTDISQTFSNTQTFSGTLSVSGTVGDDFIPNADGSYVNGTTSFRWGSIATYNADFNGVLTLQSGSTITGSILPTTNNLYALGNTSFRWSTIVTTNANISGTITAPSGSTGVSATKTVRDSAGTGTCTLIFSGGLLTGGTC